MSVKSRFANRHKRKDWDQVKDLIKLGGSMQDIDKPKELDTMPIGFLHPPGFKPAVFMVIAISAEGVPCYNMPVDQPHVCLHLATLGLAEASKRAVQHMQAVSQKQSPIVAVPPGMQIPTWNGRPGRG